MSTVLPKSIFPFLIHLYPKQILYRIQMSPIDSMVDPSGASDHAGRTVNFEYYVPGNAVLWWYVLMPVNSVPHYAALLYFRKVQKALQKTGKQRFIGRKPQKATPAECRECEWPILENTPETASKLELDLLPL